MEIERLNVAKGIESPVLSPIQFQAYGGSSTNPSKRTRLVFDQMDESSNVDEKKKPKPWKEASIWVRVMIVMIIFMFVYDLWSWLDTK